MTAENSTGPARPAVTEADALRAIAEAARGFSGDIEPTLVPPAVASLPPHAPGLSDEAIAASLNIPVSDLVRMDANENAQGPSPLALERAQLALTQVHRYPPVNSDSLRATLALRHNVRESQIVLSHGATEMIELLVRTFVGQGETVVSAWPSYPHYRLAALSQGREILMAPLREDRVDLSAMAGLVDRRAKLVFIANPNNPTGTYVPRRQMLAFLNRIPDSVIVVLDEAYNEYVSAEDYPDGIRDLMSRRRLVVLRTFSKLHGLAGLRIGYGVMESNLARFVDAVRRPFNVNTIAQAAALGALEDEAHARTSARNIAKAREEVGQALQKLGLEVVPSQTNFLLVKGAPDMRALRKGLYERGVLTRSLDAYRMPEALRVTLGTPSMNRRFVETVQSLLSGNDQGATKG